MNEVLDYVNYNINGRYYSMTKSNLLKHPDCMLTKMISTKWNDKNQNLFTIDRDSKHFETVSFFLRIGYLPRNKCGKVIANEVELTEIELEADYYNLSALSEAIIEAKHDLNSKNPFIIGPSVYIDFLKNPNDELVSSLLTLNSKFFTHGYIKNIYNSRSGYYNSSHSSLPLKDPNIFYGKCTIDTINIAELDCIAEPSHFGKGDETHFDPNIRSSIEIKAEKLDAEVLEHWAGQIDLRELLIGNCDRLVLKPYKLVIYRPGDHFSEHRDTVRCPHHVGTAVVILNSKFEGGDFCIKHGDIIKKFNTPKTYVAMYGDCIHWITPVTSGVRVTMIFDILIPTENEICHEGFKGNEDECDDFYYYNNSNCLAVESFVLEEQFYAF